MLSALWEIGVLKIIKYFIKCTGKRKECETVYIRYQIIVYVSSD